jgi:hypothetical protein
MLPAIMEYPRSFERLGTTSIEEKAAIFMHHLNVLELYWNESLRSHFASAVL